MKTYIRCFACGARLLEKNSFMAHSATDEQNVHVGAECYWKLATWPYGKDNPWQPPKGGPSLLPGWTKEVA